MIETKFNELGLKNNLLKAIDDLGYKEPSEIQAKSIPMALEGFDIIAQSQTGTGKTAAFGCSMINILEKSSGKPNALVLTPTRELAIQVSEELSKLSKYEKLSILPIYGGQSISLQARALKRPVDIVVGTPGRILDHIRRKSLHLDEVSFLVLDEADEMLNMGFIDEVESIFSELKEERQTLMFSATMPLRIKDLAKKYMKKDLKHIAIERKSMTVSKISQHYYEVKESNRFEALCRILDFDTPTNSIIFCRTKKKVDELVHGLQSRGYIVDGMHGDMSQNQRLNTLRKFKDGSLNCLIATDVAARGIDVDDVTHIINYDIPQNTEAYVHRIGRTGRANKEGTAYTLVNGKELMQLKRIQRETKGTITKKEVPSKEQILKIKNEQILAQVRENLANNNYKDFIGLAKQLEKEYNLVDVTAALMKVAFDKELTVDYSDNFSSGTDYTRIFLSLGRRDGLNKKILVMFLSDNCRVNVNEIVNIDIMENFSFMNVPQNLVDTVMSSASGKKLNGKRLNMEIAKNSR